MSLVVVTGANGFVGGGVVARLGRDPAFRVRVAVRREGGAFLSEGVEVSLVGDLGPHTDYAPALTDADAVVHCAGRVHVMRDTSSDPLAEYRSVNVEGTANLARQAAEAGVRRFIFLSTVKVNGESTQPGRPFEAGDPPGPSDPLRSVEARSREGAREGVERHGPRRSRHPAGPHLRAGRQGEPPIHDGVASARCAPPARGDRQPTQPSGPRQSLGSDRDLLAAPGCRRAGFPCERRRGPVHLGSAPSDSSGDGSQSSTRAGPATSARGGCPLLGQIGHAEKVVRFAPGGYRQDEGIARLDAAGGRR